MSFPTPWLIEPWCVYGGYRIARSRWVINREGDTDQEEEFLAPEVYPTEEACKAAILALGLPQSAGPMVAP